jgi:ribonuclease HI
VNSSPKPKRFLSVCWKFPVLGAHKLNVDGSSRGNPGHSGGGVVIRDCMGYVCEARSYYFGVQTNLHAELEALLHGLQGLSFFAVV